MTFQVGSGERGENVCWYFLPSAHIACRSGRQFCQVSPKGEFSVFLSKIERLLVMAARRGGAGRGVGGFCGVLDTFGVCFFVPLHMLYGAPYDVTNCGYCGTCTSSAVVVRTCFRPTPWLAAYYYCRTDLFYGGEFACAD